MAKEKVELINGFCNPKCIYYEKQTIPSFTEESHKTDIDLCTYGGSARSFGCMNGCLNGQPQLEEIKKEE